MQIKVGMIGMRRTEQGSTMGQIQRFPTPRLNGRCRIRTRPFPATIDDGDF
jgi:hypothetical protein